MSPLNPLSSGDMSTWLFGTHSPLKYQRNSSGMSDLPSGPAPLSPNANDNVTVESYFNCERNDRVRP